MIQYLNKEFGHRIDIDSIYTLRNKLDPILLLIKETKDNSILDFQPSIGSETVSYMMNLIILI